MEINRERKSRRAEVPIGLTPMAKDMRAVMRELLDGYEHMVAPVADSVADDEMECGGRKKLHEHLGSRAQRRTAPLPCGQCAVAGECTIGLARND